MVRHNSLHMQHMYSTIPYSRDNFKCVRKVCRRGYLGLGGGGVENVKSKWNSIKGKIIGRWEWRSIEDEGKG